MITVAGYDVAESSVYPDEVFVTAPDGERWRVRDGEDLGGFFFRFLAALQEAERVGSKDR